MRPQMSHDARCGHVCSDLSRIKVLIESHYQVTLNKLQNFPGWLVSDHLFSEMLYVYGLRFCQLSSDVISPASIYHHWPDSVTTHADSQPATPTFTMPLKWGEHGDIITTVTPQDQHLLRRHQIDLCDPVVINSMHDMKNVNLIISDTQRIFRKPLNEEMQTLMPSRQLLKGSVHVVRPQQEDAEIFSSCHQHQDLF